MLSSGAAELISRILQLQPANLHTCRCLLQDQEAAGAMKAEMPMGIRTVIEMRLNSRSHKLCGREIKSL